MSRFRYVLSALVAVPLFAAVVYAQASDRQLPCESYSKSGAVFVGVATAPVKRWVQLADHGPIELKLTPVTVERAYLGVTTPVMYLTPLGVEHYATPGRRYLVYGQKYNPPDIVMPVRVTVPSRSRSPGRIWRFLTPCRRAESAE